MVVESKGWDWGVVKGGRAEYWRAPSKEAYYLVQRWKELGLRDFLDLGCGLGRHAILFGENGFQVSCFDFSEEALEKTKKWAQDEGPEYKVPHFYADYDALRELVADFEVIDIRQVEEFRQKPGETRVYESWSYHTLVRKVEQNF